MLKSILGALALALLTTCAWAAPLRITNDHGGLIVERAFQIRHLVDHGRSVVIDGRCDSACTMYLGLPAGQVCVTRRSVLGFHATSLGPDSEMTLMVLASYPAAVRQWIADRGGLTERLIHLEGPELWRRVPLCR